LTDRDRLAAIGLAAIDLAAIDLALGDPVKCDRLVSPSVDAAG
jgi:hypothetical protein